MPRYNGQSQRQKLAIQYYRDPQSETFDNAAASARKAGYTADYARSIMVYPWWKERNAQLDELDNVEIERKAEERRALMLAQAESNLGETLTMPTDEDARLVAIKHDATKYVTSTLGKRVYSTRTENVNSVPTVLDGEKGQLLHTTLSQYLGGQNEQLALQSDTTPQEQSEDNSENAT